MCDSYYWKIDAYSIAITKIWFTYLTYELQIFEMLVDLN